MKRLRALVFSVASVVAGGLPVQAAAASPTLLAATGEVPTGAAVLPTNLAGGQWTVGALALGIPVGGVSARAGQLPGQMVPVRLGPGLSFTSLGEGAVLRTWTGQAIAGDGTRQSFSGVLMDISYGSFTFTPSVGAGYSAPPSTSGHSAVAVRSQFEVSYRFENASNLSLGYSRLSVGNGVGIQRDDSEMVSLTYRLPFTSLWPW